MVRYVRDGGTAETGMRPMLGRTRAWLGPAICASACLLAHAPGAQGDPINTARPTITGKLEVGQTLTASTGTWTDPTSRIVRYEYAWFRCVFPGAGEDCLDTSLGQGNQLTIPLELDGDATTVTVVAIDELGKESFGFSEETAVITDNIPHYAVSEEVSGGGSLTGAADNQTGAFEDMNFDCPGACGADYPYASGTSIELTAHPVLGATFLGWGGACSGTAPTCSFVVSAATTVTAAFTPAPLPPQLLGPPEGREALAPPAGGVAGGAGAGAGVLGSEGALDQGEAPTSSVAHLPARLLGLRAQHGHHLQATVACQQARACRLTLAVSSEAPGARLVAARTITLAPGRRAHIGLALDHAGAHLLAHRRRLPVTAHLMLREGGREVAVGGARLTLIA